MFTPKRISLDCPFTSNQRPSTFLILTLRCAICLCSGLHTVEIVSPVCCTLLSLSLQCVAHLGDRLRGGMHIVHCTPEIEYLGKIKTEFQYTLAFISGAQMGSNHKKWRSKISLHTPFNTLCNGILFNDLDDNKDNNFCDISK